jgi:NADP-dependent aldehyde dehydrogenase
MPSQSVDPRTGTAFGPVIADSTADEVRQVCAQAKTAASGWGSMSRPDRARALRAAADALDAAGDELIPLADSESGLGITRLTGELARTTFQIRMFADAIEEGSFQGIIIDPAVDAPVPAGHPDLRRMLVPLGPVAVFGASNFPFAFSVAGGDTASALAAGCPVVVKAHPAHPQLSIAVHSIVAQALVGAGAPSGVFGLVHGFEAGQLLVTDPSIKAAAFTGSGPGGRALFDLAVSRPDPIPFYGELGSVNPVFVTPEAASRESLPTDYLDSLLLGGGQFCTNPSVLFVPQGSGVVERIVDLVAQRPAAVLLHAGVKDLFARRSVQLAGLEGVEVIAGQPGSGDEPGFAQSPVLFRTTGQAVLADRAVLEIECFGPAGVIVEYASPDEALSLSEVIDGCLAATVHGAEGEALAAELVCRVAASAGRVIWNGWPTGVSVTAAQQHGGPHPSTTNALHTSVGTTGLRRFLRPVAYQSMPAALLPADLRG